MFERRAKKKSDWDDHLLSGVSISGNPNSKICLEASFRLQCRFDVSHLSILGVWHDLSRDNGRFQSNLDGYCAVPYFNDLSVRYSSTVTNVIHLQLNLPIN